MFPGIRLIVLDLDGTLVDTFEDIAAAANDALRSLGRRPVDTATVIRNVGHGGRNLMRALLGDGATEEEIDRAFEGWRAYYLRHPADLARPYPGVGETLVELRRRGVRLAVLSNKSHDLVCTILARLDLEPFFDAIQGEAPGQPSKPDPAALVRFMEQAGARAEETLMVGDGVADVQVARNAGVAAVGVDYGVAGAADLEELGAAIVIGRFADLLGLI